MWVPALPNIQIHDTILIQNKSIGGLPHMGLLQEWYTQETRDSEEEKFHRPLNDEQLFFHAVSSGDIDFVRQNCKEKSLSKQKASGFFHAIR